MISQVSRLLKYFNQLVTEKLWYLKQQQVSNGILLKKDPPYPNLIIFLFFETHRKKLIVKGYSLNFN